MKPKLILFLSLILIGVASCKKGKPAKPNDPDGGDNNNQSTNWTQMNDFAGGPASRGFAFVIGSKAYYVGGYIRQNGKVVDAFDLWEYDPTSDKWTKKTGYPGQGSENLAGFVIDGKAYVGTGFGRQNGDNNASVENNDLWQYDPSADTWAKKAPFPGLGRENAFSFSINGYGYIGGGWSVNATTTNLPDTWKYDPTADAWAKASDFPGITGEGAISIAVNNLGYVFGGLTLNGISSKQCWQYDGVQNKWIRKTDAVNQLIYSGVVTDGSKIYIVSGDDNTTSPSKQVLAYDVTADNWSKLADFPGAARTDMASFSVNGAGYIMTGTGATLSDVWKFNP